jgi:hypothetical protein
MTDKQKLAADYVVALYKQKNGVTQNKTAFLNAVDRSKHNLSDIRYAIEILLHKGFLAVTDGVVKENIFMTDKGWLYESYDKLLADEKRKNDLEEALITSSIASNKSVKYVNRLFWLTAAFAFFSSVSTVGTFILELHKGEQKPSQETSTSYLDTTKKSNATQPVPDSLTKK